MSRSCPIQARKDVQAMRRSASLRASSRRARYALAALAFVALTGVALQPVACGARTDGVGAARTLPQQAAHSGPAIAGAAAVPAGDPPHPGVPCCATHAALAAQIVQKVALALPETSSPVSLAAFSETRYSPPSAPAERAQNMREASRASAYHARTTRRLF